jgi:hypothetical protein
MAADAGAAAAAAAESRAFDAVARVVQPGFDDVRVARLEWALPGRSAIGRAVDKLH